MLAPNTLNDQRSRVLQLALWCLTMLSFVSISPPENFRGGAAGLQSILPPTVIKLAKLGSRSATLVVIAYSVTHFATDPRLTRAILGILPVFLYVAYAIISTSWSALPAVTLQQSVTLLMLLMLGVTIGLSWRSVEDTSKLLRRVTVVMTCLATGLLVLRLGAPQYGALTKDASGVFHSTAAGAMSSVTVMVLLLSALLWGWKWSRQMLVPGLLIHTTLLVIAGNRLSLGLCLLLGCGAVTVYLPKQRVAALAIACGILGTMYLALDSRLTVFRDSVGEVGVFASQGQSRRSLESLSGRAEMWEAMWKSYLDSPLVGHGYFVTSAGGEVYVWHEWGNWTAHNWTLQLLVTTGAIGGVLLIGGLLWVAMAVATKYRFDPRLAQFLGVLFLWYLGWGMLNASYLGPLQPESIVFAVVLGLAVSMLLREDTFASEDTSASLGSEL